MGIAIIMRLESRLISKCHGNGLIELTFNHIYPLKEKLFF